MTTTTAAPPTLGRPGPAPLRLMRSELLKIITTNAWWLLMIGALALLALAFLVNAIGADFAFNQPTPEGIPAEDRAAFEATRNEVYQAANLYTSGQFFGLMFVMLLGIVLMTSEFFHQTATATFLTTPHRTAVVLAKLAVAALCGAVLWALTTALTVPATAVFLQRYDMPSHLGDWPVQRAIMLNLLAYAIWGMFGVSLGVLLRSQIGATVTAVALYLIGTAAVQIILTILEQQLGWDWVSNIQYALPAVASALMVTGTDLPGEPAWWVGGLVLVAYVVVAGGLGVLINRRRDVS
ncbi:MAG TPA: ABC transporter permease [Micromonosporaceae bacterium]|nr:ABC transporter permease [Micromonosporaceae bacterium]